MLPQKQTLDMMQTTWASEINPLLANPLVNGIILKNVPLAVGVNNINHLLNRKLQGWFVVGMHGVFAQIYDTPSPSPLVTLVLHASAITSVDLYVF